MLALVVRHGWNSVSFQVLEPGFSYFWDGDDACVAYVDTGSAWVTAGPPLTEPARLAAAMTRFHHAARVERRRVCCFATEGRFHELVNWPALRIGDQPSWAPADWAGALGRKRSLREQLRRARVKGVAVRAIGTHELSRGHRTRDRLDGLIARWLRARPMAPMGFLVQVDPFGFPEQRRHFVAEQDGLLVGFLGIAPIYARPGWFFENFLRDPEAPNGTVELLVDAAMRAAAAERVPYVTLGLVPLAGDVDRWLRMAGRAGRALYDFDGLRGFKAKLAPRAWAPIYLAHPPGSSSVLAVYDALGAFAKNGLVTFGMETLLRGPAIVTRLLAILLFPWTILLMLPSSSRFFPSPAWQWAWAAFDTALGIALFRLSRRWTNPLADLVVGAVTMDAFVTVTQVALFDLPRLRHVLDAVTLFISVAAPALASVLLWNARAHRTPKEEFTSPRRARARIR